MNSVRVDRRANDAVFDERRAAREMIRYAENSHMRSLQQPERRPGRSISMHNLARTVRCTAEIASSATSRQPRLQGGSGMEDADVAAALRSAVQQVLAMTGLPGSR
jgi:hypothetical protein